jgi:shikimate dehydrogenase
MIRAAVLGADVRRSRSPAIHGAAFLALRKAGSYEPLSVDAEGFGPLVAELRARGYRYLNVTIPHKAAAAALADHLGPEARAAGAVNTLIFEPARPGRRARVRGENTDGAGLLAALADLGVVVGRGTSVVMVGAGGAAAGAVEALTRAGARVKILARRPAAARALRLHLPARQRARVSVAAWMPRSLAAALPGAAALVSAIPAAAWDAGALEGLAGLERTTAVLEMAYGGTSPLARACRPRTPRYADGLGMLVHQAARAVELAIGKAPPVAPLLRAAQGR